MNRKEKPAVLPVIPALFVMLLWGSLFPCIKLGYRAFSVDTGAVAEVLMFAAIRFLICGAFITAVAALKGQKIHPALSGSIIPVFLTGIFSVVLHYAFTYVGLTLTDSSKAAILKQVGVLFYICFSFLFLKDEAFSAGKIAGALLGFAGIAAINTNVGGFSFGTGEMLILLASLCTVASNIAAKKAMKSNPSMLVTGISQLFGGGVLFAVSLAMGASIPFFTWKASFVLAYICAASSVGYCLWFYIVRSGELSRLFIIKFAEPVFACIFSALLLSENIFKWQYFIAFLLISAGILLGNLCKRPVILQKKV